MINGPVPACYPGVPIAHTPDLLPVALSSGGDICPTSVIVPGSAHDLTAAAPTASSRR